MELTLEEVKTFLKLDCDEEDSYIKLLISNADEFLRDSIDNYDAKLTFERFADKAKLLKLLYIQNMYSNRELQDDGNSQLKYTVQSMLRQMQYITYDGV